MTVHSSAPTHASNTSESSSFPDVIKQHATSTSTPTTPTQHTQTQPNASSSSPSYAFLSDAEIGASRLFRLVCLYHYIMCRYFHSYSVQGLDTLDRTKGALFFTLHTTHSADIFAILCSTFIVTGRVCRSLIHRWIIAGYPYLKYFGSVAGERNAAHELLTRGYWTAVIPGGAPEALVGNDHAYELRWGERNGFAAVAMRAGVPLYPTFTVNMEEMRFNPIFFLWNRLNLYKPYDWIIQKNIPYITRAIYYIAMTVWWNTSFLCIPIPVPIKVIVGDAIPYQPDEDPRVVADRAHVALQSLIDQHQGRRHMDHIAALKMKYTMEQIYMIIAGYITLFAILIGIVIRFYW